MKMSLIIGASIATSIILGGWAHGFDHGALVTFPTGAIGLWEADTCAANKIVNAQSSGNGDATFDGTQTCSGGILTINSTPGSISFNSSSLFSAFTVVAVGRKTAAASTYGSILVNTPGPGPFNAAFDDNEEANFAGVTVPDPDTEFANVAPGYTYQPPGLWNLSGAGWHSFSHRYDGNKFNLFFDDVKLFDSYTFGGEANLYTGYTQTLQNFFLSAPGYDIQSVAFWNRALSDAEVRAAYGVLKAHAALSSITITPVSKILVAEGDSITWSSYPFTYGSNHTSFFGDVPATPGSILKSIPGEEDNVKTMAFRAPMIDAIIPPNKNGREFILTILIGSNDLLNYQNLSTATLQANQYATDLAAYAAARKAAGYDKVALITILPRCDTGYSGFNTVRDIFNPIVTAGGWAGAHNFDAIIDFAGQATVGVDAACSNATYFPDGVHPSAAAYALLYPIYETAVNGL